MTDASSSNEAVHLQQRLKSLSTELVTLRNRLHVASPPGAPGKSPAPGSPQSILHPPGPVKAHQTLPLSTPMITEPGDNRTSNEAHVQSDPMSPRSIALTDIHDLIHLTGPLTEDAVLKCLQARFGVSQYFTNVGSILLSVNPYQDVGNPLTLTSTKNKVLSERLLHVVKEAVNQQSETGYPQAIILSGCSGSGKTYTSMLLLRQLFKIAGGGPETDAFKHLAAAFTVLRSLGSAKTASSCEASRIGQFIEVQVTDGALYRTKIHCYFLDQTRVIRQPPTEKNYHIFYQMLAGLTAEERAKLTLEGYTVQNLRYLQQGDTNQDVTEDAARFQAWKTCLGILGIPFIDVVRVLAAVLLLGNVAFVDGAGMEVEIYGDAELNAVAGLLSVSPQTLFRGLTSRTHNTMGQVVKSFCDANISNMTRDALAKALYCRTVATIVRRANSLKRLGSTLGTLSSDSNESVHNQGDVASQHASTVGTSGSKSSKSMVALNNAVRHATDGFIGILDMFGFENPKPSQLEHLCINLCAETMQHFYNTHIFKSSIESCRDEGIRCDVEVDYVDNVPCIDLISSLRTGLLSMLDVECSVRGTVESYLSKIRVQHKQNQRLSETKQSGPRTFAVQHFAGKVVYDASDFLDTNRDIIPDDLVAVFHKQNCTFGFATHLFGSELKALFSTEKAPRGVSFRISPTSHVTDMLSGNEPVSTLTQDFHTRLDNLLRTLVHARPHFVRCIRSNAAEEANVFDRNVVVAQIRSLQVLETVNLMAGGYPHRMRFKVFVSRYRLLAPACRLRREDKISEDTNVILSCLVLKPDQSPYQVTTSWAFGKRHIFLSEGARQQLEHLRTTTRHRSAIIIQSNWRGWYSRRRWPALRRSLTLQLNSCNLANGNVCSNVTTNSGLMSNGSNILGELALQFIFDNLSVHHLPHHLYEYMRVSLIHKNRPLLSGVAGKGVRPRPQPIAGTPPPDPTDKCDQKMIQQTCTLFGLDLERPPPVPPSRPYTVTGNSKLGYPQTRIMKMSFPEGTNEPSLSQGATVLVLGASPRRGHLLVANNNTTLHVPFQFLELKSGPVNI
ncbi:hypothetical protein RUM43_013296 [Polyplax serrata]|uniref:Myosin motor domain-containing protein n=1 Tax=Polyplax serrata TaxID=468196 RepID=A0AAN8P559_POLSC